MKLIQKELIYLVDLEQRDHVSIHKKEHGTFLLLQTKPYTKKKRLVFEGKLVNIQQ